MCAAWMDCTSTVNAMLSECPKYSNGIAFQADWEVTGQIICIHNLSDTQKEWKLWKLMENYDWKHFVLMEIN